MAIALISYSIHSKIVEGYYIYAEYRFLKYDYYFNLIKLSKKGIWDIIEMNPISLGYFQQVCTMFDDAYAGDDAVQHFS